MLSNKAPNTETVDETFGVNYYGTVELTEKLQPYMAKHGKIVNVSSSLGKFFHWTNQDLVKRFENPNITMKELNQLANEYRESIEKGTWKAEGYPKSLFGDIPAIYDVSKTLLTIYSRILGKDEDIVKRNIQVYAICPGWVQTDMGGPSAPRTIE